MRPGKWCLAPALILAVCLPRLLARERPPEGPTASYSIDVRLDAEAHTLDGRQTLTWRNATLFPADELRFHLYLNAFKNDRSTFMRESRGVSRGHRMREGQWGHIDVVSMVTSGGEDLLASARFVSPDDGNPEDETVLRVPLTAPVAPGESLELEIAFGAQLPRVFARTGFKGDFHLVAQWFPKIGVLEDTGWNCHQFHSFSEFYSDFGDYDVRLTVPREYVVGATGLLAAEPTENEDGTLTYRYVQEGVHDFAWTADPDFIRVVRPFLYESQRDPIEEKRVAHALGVPEDSERLRLRDVEVTLLIQPEHEAQIDRHFEAAFHGLRYFGYWYGSYPYDTLTIVDPTYGARGARGMEYPTFITAGTRYFAPARRQSPEAVTIHEFGHQFWYGQVANNEFEEAFLDEGFNTYSTGLVLEKAYGPNRDHVEIAPGIPYLAVPLFTIPKRPSEKKADSGETDSPARFTRGLADLLLLRPFGASDDTTLNSFRDLPWLSFVPDVGIDQVTHQRRRYLSAPTADELARRSWEYRNRKSYGLNSYARTALVLRTLEGILGKDTMLRVMDTYFRRYRYRHPDVNDFIATVHEVSGRRLDEFFRQAVFGSELLDYSVEELSSDRPKRGTGVFGPPEDRVTLTPETDRREPAQGASDYESRVLIVRNGGFEWPQEIDLEHEDADVDRAEWDGRYRWTRIEETGPRLLSARIDPEEKLALEANRTNNSRSRQRNPVAGLKWWSRLLQWMQQVSYFYSGIS